MNSNNNKIITEKIWLICGGRDYDNVRQFNTAMKNIMLSEGRPTKIIHGGARGADTLADKFAKGANITCKRYRAQWDKHGKAAGPIRNQEMLDKGQPNLVIAFPGSVGTSDMVKRAKDAGVKVIRVPQDFNP